MTKENQKELEKAKRDLEEFLREHPHLRQYQKEIDRVLDSSTDRMETIAIMLAGRLSDLHCHMQELLYCLDELSHEIYLSEAA